MKAQIVRNNRLLDGDHPGTMKPRTSKRYHTLLERTPGQLWHPQFGDFDREVVKQEMQDMRESGSFVRGTTFTIITTSFHQTVIAEAIEQLNIEIAPKALKEKLRT